MLSLIKNSSMLRCPSILARTLNVLSTQQQCTKVTLPDLPYDYNALEPVISTEIMQLHHSKHHQAYVNNLNVALEKMEEAKSKNDVKTIIELEPALRFNGGGHINHSIFWHNLAPVGKSGEPKGELLQAINSCFGSLDDMKARVSQLAIGVQGSGWAWLGRCPKSGQLRAVACPNQDPLEATTGLVPLFGIDVWEHAYYLQYKNVRPDYVNAIWKVANWNDIEQRFMAAKPK
ncbi:superoxide dismutase 2 [Dermatophagoides pteronyssinus]|uniref:Superoxide dismutase n=2 Tax=Dermatophagoides pteronyssinus TaxID=6956 RepID=A0A6P6Y4W4_DERPT|nr:superoxide dismutase [Mn], mitochondrial-like [Dermatophagoides pteronyssinus]KAH9419747.1 Superoxide dismutase [Mn], mitochondrial [Dermatophagoides pteronyssinus]